MEAAVPVLLDIVVASHDVKVGEGAVKRIVVEIMAEMDLCVGARNEAGGGLELLDDPKVSAPHRSQGAEEVAVGSEAARDLGDSPADDMAGPVADVVPGEDQAKEV